MVWDWLHRRARRHDWFKLLIDLVVLVLGVFLGLQANNWNQARLSRAAGHEYRQRLIDDLTANQIDLRNRAQYYGAVRSHAEATLAALDGAAEPDETFLIHAYQASQIAPRQLKRLTYDEMVSNGSFQSLGDAALREQVANYYVGLAVAEITFDNIPPYREHIRSIMPAAVQRAIRTRCAEQLSFTADGTVWAKLPDNCSLGLPPTVLAAAAKQVRAAADLRDDLNRQIADLDVKISLVAPFVGNAGHQRQAVADADDRS